MKKLILFILLILAINFIFIYYNPIFSGNAIKESFETGFVTKVIDGDTVIVDGESVRLLGIDTAERGEPCYKEAKERLETLVLNREVILEKDVQDKDQYKRLLRYLILEENNEKININLKLVEEGLAIARFYEDRKYRDEILKAEKKARDNKIGCKWN